MKNLTILAALSFLLLATPANAARLDAYANKATLNNADEFVLWDSSAAAVRNINWTSLYNLTVGASVNWSTLPGIPSDYVDGVLNRASINWTSLNQDIQRSGVNWASLNQDIQAAGVNWSSVNGSNIQRAGINWASLSNDIQNAGINWTSIPAASIAGTKIQTQMSITSDSSGLKLSADSSSPGNNKVYGTDGSGVKGWKNDPSGSSQWTTTGSDIYFTGGNVGIGTSSALDKALKVNGTAQFGTAATGTWAATSGLNFDPDNDGTNEATMSTAGDLTVPAETYDATGWDGDNTVPTKNDVRDKIETISAGSGGWTDGGTNMYATTTTDTVGIGTTNAEYRLHVKGTGTGNVARFVIENTSNTAGAFAGFGAKNNNGKKMEMGIHNVADGERAWVGSEAQGVDLISGDNAVAYLDYQNGFKLVPPSAQTIAAGNTITADACGGIKIITAGGAVTTSTTNTFTAPAATNASCCMDVINTGSNAITLDDNANFNTTGDIVLGQFDTARVCSTGASGTWNLISTSNN